MTPAEFTARFGRAPQQDDLHRVTCDRAGMVGHTACGICDEHDRPRFECGCILIPYMANFHAPAIEVEHAKLVRTGDSAFRSKCPVCKLGILFVYRVPPWGALRRDDRCIRCAQRIRYTDTLPIIQGETWETE